MRGLVTTVRDVIIAFAVLLLVLFLLNHLTPGKPGSSTPIQSTPGMSAPTCTVEAADPGSPTDQRALDTAKRLCDALAGKGPGLADGSDVPTAQETRQACEDLHKQRFMLNVDCNTVNPNPPYYYHH